MDRKTFITSLLAAPAGVASAVSETVPVEKKLMAKLDFGDRQIRIIVTDEEREWLEKRLAEDYENGGIGAVDPL